jgi:hypothetical protein
MKRRMVTKDVLVLILGTCEEVMLHKKRLKQGCRWEDVANQLTLRECVHPGLYRQTQYNHKCCLNVKKRKAERPESE